MRESANNLVKLADVVFPSGSGPSRLCVAGDYAVSRYGGGDYVFENTASGQMVHLSRVQGQALLRKVPSDESRWPAYFESVAQSYGLQITPLAVKPADIERDHICTLCDLTNRAAAQCASQRPLYASAEGSDGVGRFFEYLSQRGAMHLNDDGDLIAMTAYDFVVFMAERFGLRWYLAETSSTVEAKATPQT